MIRLAFLSLVRRPLRQFLLFLLIVVTCALPVFILQMAGGLYGGINRAVSPFPILAGAKGSAYQLVLNTVFLRDRPVGNIPYEEMEKLMDTGKTQAVYPLGFGDNYRGFRIVGTSPDLFAYRPVKNKAPWLSLQEGQIFKEEGEAVIGSETARLTGLKVGDTFRSVHGTSPKGRAHDHPFRVTGIVKPVGGPYDTAIFIDMKDVWEAHGEKDEAHREVTALLVVPKGYKEAMSLLAEEGMLLLAGSCAGWLAGYGASLGAARMVAGSAAITMVTSPDWRGALIIPLVTILGTAAGLLPALLLGRKDVSSYL